MAKRRGRPPKNQPADSATATATETARVNKARAAKRRGRRTSAAPADPPTQQDLIEGGIHVDIPEAVQTAATDFKNASVAKSKASAKFNGKRDNLIELMREHKIESVPIELGGVSKVIRLEDLAKLKIESPKKSPEAGDTSELEP